MAWSKKGSIKGPKGDAGKPDYSTVYPVGTIITNTGASPAETVGGTWVRLPSLGACTWERTK